MQITITVTKDGDEGKFKAKFGTSRGGGQERINNASFEDIANKLTRILEDANDDGFIGKK